MMVAKTKKLLEARMRISWGPLAILINFAQIPVLHFYHFAIFTHFAILAP